MILGELQPLLSQAQLIGEETVEVTGIAYDSRLVKPGNLFCAIPGFRTDGHLYCADAAQRGAQSFLVERAEAIPAGFSGLVVKNAREAMAVAANQFFGVPSRRLMMVGVTGTNGKTTITHLIRYLLESENMPCGLTGTLHTLIGQDVYTVLHTTPEAPDLQSLLRHMVDRGMQAAVMEVSSHALALRRVDKVEYDIAVFTNLTQDHLDFHPTFEDYFAAKALLFQRLNESEKNGPHAALINIDDAYGARMAQISTAPVLTYGINHPADMSAENVRITPKGSQFVAHFPDQTTQVIDFPMTGRFNVSNALAALLTGHVLGLRHDIMAQALARYPGVPGRFERIDEGQPFTVIVDYAHTPDGFDNVLRTAKEFTAGAIGVVFGAGGDRDHGKRALMGEMAAKWADWIVLTADNPRSEDPIEIIHQIVQGIEPFGTPYTVELDRKRAIGLALKKAKPGDVVLLLGKGHENYQIYRDGTIHFDDREVARKILREI
ncbi:MAG: UDP-N-acetylmuramoyl-L-alanyl-D-glutamate--2,6-diaminopimelate ligase [Firmicutes bacterium]|nr:UDP-N-acetylmuramoyl-L-alanyl-D-glutamate--2,6-diaminopimelate ligase [Bacillota bacterium]